MTVPVEAATPTPSPPLKWAGGKRWLVPRLALRWSGHAQRRLVEPFVGGLAVVLGLSPKKALLNDHNPHLISFYRWLQHGLDPTSVRVNLVNARPVFNANRDRFNFLIANGKADTTEAAVLFYYLNRTAFNGLCRFNSRGYFNVPFGAYKTIRYKDARDFAIYKEALAGYDFRCDDFERLSIRAGDFIYADPPYDVQFTSFTAGGFSWGDQQRLARWLAGQRVPVIASNQATRRILNLYKDLGFRVRTLAAPRRISCDGNREPAREMLATLNL